MPLALSTAEKSVTVQTHTINTQTHKQTVNDISTPCLLACKERKELTPVIQVFNTARRLKDIGKKV